MGNMWRCFSSESASGWGWGGKACKGYHIYFQDTLFSGKDTHIAILTEGSKGRGALLPLRFFLVFKDVLMKISAIFVALMRVFLSQILQSH